MDEINATERRKRYTFLATGAAGVAATALLTPWVGIPVLVVSSVVGFDWFKFRGKNGLRF
jgi:hypothetical protein